MTYKEKTIANLQEALNRLDITSDLRLVLIQTIEYLQEEPVGSIWHDASEIPQEKKVCLIRYSANDGASTNNFEVVIAEPLTRRFVTRSYPHKTGYQYTIHGENTIKVDAYQNRRDHIPFSDIDEWAYIDDFLNLSNVQRTVKNWKEPVSEELDEAAKHHLYSNILYDDVYVGNPTDKDCVEMFKAGAKWKEQQMMAKAVEGGCFSYKNGFVHISCDVDECITNIKFGDKVKIIVIKED